MGFSKLKIPKICEQYGKVFEVKTVVPRFCGYTYANKSDKEKKKQVKEAEQVQNLLEESAEKIVQMQTHPYIPITGAPIFFGISKYIIRRLIKEGKVPAINLGLWLTRVIRAHLDEIFTAVKIPEEAKEQPVKLQYEINKFYTIFCECYKSVLTIY